MFSFKVDLLSASAIGNINWAFGLDYLAGNGVDSVLGKGFSYPQYMRLEVVAGGNVELVSGQNTHETFLVTTYEVAPTNNTQAVLSRAGSGASDTFTLRSSQGTTTLFYGFDPAIPAPGRLKSITDRHGNTQSYSWQVAGGQVQLASETDSYNRTITYTYYGSEGGYRLREIEDFLGRKLNFQYDSAGHLAAAVSPSVLKAAPGNTFPGGTAYAFQYDLANPRPERRDDLIKIWYPNQVARYLDSDTRTVDLDQLYTDAVPRYVVEYGQDPTDEDYWGRVVRETVGDPAGGVGGILSYQYTTANLPTNIIAGADPDPIVFRAIVTDRNSNQTIYDFNAQQMPVRAEVMRTRSKINIPTTIRFPSYVTWTKYNQNNQPVKIVFPEGNTREYDYETGTGVVTGITVYNRRRGLLLRQTALVGNDIGIDVDMPRDTPTDGELTKRYSYDPIFNQLTATIEERGNPIDTGGTYFTPQNGTTAPDDTDRSAYATIVFFDYQKNMSSTVKNAAMQSFMGLTGSQIQDLLDFVDAQMIAEGLPGGFDIDLADINGDGTGDGASSGLPAAAMLGSVVKIHRPTTLAINFGSQVREELFTSNARGQVTTHTDPEGNLTVYVRYPDNDPEGDGQFIAANSATTGKQYGRLREIHVDANPDDVMSLIGADGDLVDFIGGIITRTNTPDIYQDLVTRYEGSGGGSGCAACAYDPLGNPLAVTDARGFTTRYERNELGEVFRTTAPQPYLYQIETHFDANRNIVRVDTEDQVVDFDSADPTSACYAQFSPSGSGSTAHVPTKPGPGGSIRPGWFTNLYEFDLLDNLIEQDIDATGSNPSSLVTTYGYDANQNMILVNYPAGNQVKYDYDERNLRIGVRVGSGDEAAVTITTYDGNGNVLQLIGPAQRGASGNWQTVILEDAFFSGETLTHTGDWLLENSYDGFDRVILAIDAAGGTAAYTYDPGSRIIDEQNNGQIDGTTPIDRSGTGNVLLSEHITRFDEAGQPYESQDEVFLSGGVSLPGSPTITHGGGGLETNANLPNHFGIVTLTTGGASYVLTRTNYDRSGRPNSTYNDKVGDKTLQFDGANRTVFANDTDLSDSSMEFDATGNLARVLRTDYSAISPNTGPETFESRMFFDALGRLVMQIEQGADGTIDSAPDGCPLSDATPTSSLVTRFGYDSRGNQTLVIDPKGNTTISVYDGASRQIQTQQHLRENGQGQNPPVANQTLLPGNSGSITTTMVLDGNGRLGQLVDDRGNATGYTYDTLDRQVLMIFQDGSTRESVYNEASDVVTYTDENGSVFENTFDPLGRKTAVDITPAQDVAGSLTGGRGTLAQAFEYDGLSRLTLADDTTDTTSPTSAETARAEFFYDSLSRVLVESQTFAGNTRNVVNKDFRSYPVIKFVFPSGRELTDVYDVFYRRMQVKETSSNTNIAQYFYYGASRLAEIRLGNGLIGTWLNNARTRSSVQDGQSTPSWGNQSSDRLGFDGAGRPMTKRYLAGGISGSPTFAYNNTSAVVGFTTEYDRAGNKLYERGLQCPERSHLYEPIDNGVAEGGYDSVDRLRQYQRGTLDTDGGSIATAITLPTANESQSYDLDGLGNWRKTAIDPVGSGPTTQVRQHNGVNQLLKFGSTAVSYDHGNNASSGDANIERRGNGNVTDDGTRIYLWDALNRLKFVNKVSDGALLATYTYDALGRRIRKDINDLGGGNGGLTGDIPAGITDYIKLGEQTVEERDGSNAVTKQCVWGHYIDELIQQKNVAAINGFAANSVVYPLQDLLYRTIALSDSTGAVLEAYDYDAYGNTIIFRNGGSPLAVIDWDDADTQVNYPTCEFLFTGRRFDAETQIYFYRARYYMPSLGRFLGRDPVRAIPNSLNSCYFLRGNPVSFTDPMGREAVGALAGCGIGFVGGVVGGAFGNLPTLANEGWGNYSCKVGCSAAGGCVTGAIIGAFPSWQAGCIGGVVGSLVSTACESIAGVRGPLTQCDFWTTLVNGLTGCFGGVGSANFEKVLFLLGINASIWSASCENNAADRGRLGSACCTFQSGGAVWRESVDCPITSGPFACCRRRADGIFTTWVVNSASMGTCRGQGRRR